PKSVIWSTPPFSRTATAVLGTSLVLCPGSPSHEHTCAVPMVSRVGPPLTAPCLATSSVVRAEQGSNPDNGLSSVAGCEEAELATAEVGPPPSASGVPLSP